MNGWWRLYATSVGLGLRYLVRHGYLREAVVRVVVPLDPVRYVELPWALRALGASPGERVLDLASPKLLAVVLARSGVRVTSVDELPREIEAWRRLTRGAPELELTVADGRALPFADESFDHAMSISVLEHVADDGDAEALAELARCVRPGARVAITLPFARRAWDEYRREAAYVDRGGDARGHFFQRWYDDERVDMLLARVPELRVRERTVVRLAPNWHRAYTRLFPWLVPLGPLYGVLARERADDDGDVIRLLLERAS